MINFVRFICMKRIAALLFFCFIIFFTNVFADKFEKGFERLKIYDYFLATGSRDAVNLFVSAVETLRINLDRYDLGFWSLYEQSGTRLPMIASPFYHRLHITQLRVMHRITSEAAFARYAERWESYSRSTSKRTRALCYKSAFKLCYY